MTSEEAVMCGRRMEIKDDFQLEGSLEDPRVDFFRKSLDDVLVGNFRFNIWRK